MLAISIQNIQVGMRCAFEYIRALERKFSPNKTNTCKSNKFNRNYLWVRRKHLLWATPDYYSVNRKPQKTTTVIWGRNMNCGWFDWSNLLLPCRMRSYDWMKFDSGTNSFVNSLHTRRSLSNAQRIDCERALLRARRKPFGESSGDALRVWSSQWIGNINKQTGKKHIKTTLNAQKYIEKHFSFHKNIP